MPTIERLLPTSLALMALLLWPSSAIAASSVRPDQLRCEYLSNPLGIDVVQPRLSWTLSAEKPASRGLKQTARRILVATSEDKLRAGTGDLWDSGRVESDQSIQVVYGGKPLGSRVRAFWKVQVWDQAGKPSAWSAPAFWTMGLLNPEDWQAKWIGRDEAQISKDRVLPARMLRRDFTASGQVKRATAFVSGLGLFELYLNGRKVGDHVLSPGLTGYDKHVLYVTHDVTSQVASGKNAIGLILGNGRYFAPRATEPIASNSYGYPKARLQLEIEYADGTRSVVVSDENWKLTTAGPILANNEYDGEDYDATREIAGWSNPGLDDASWQPAQLVAAPGGTLVAQMIEPLRVIETLHPVKVTQPKPGAYVFDMGQQMVGWCRLKVSGAKGTRVTLRHAETLQSDGTLYVANLRSAKATDTYTLKGQETEIWEPRFTYHGFRFVEVQGYPGEPPLAALEGRVVHDALTPTVDFSSSNPLLDRIHKNIYWGVRGNYRSIPTDCPQRDERQGWLGDRSQVSRSESYLFDVSAFYTKWMRDLEDAQNPAGSIPDVAPTYWTIYSDNITWPSTFIFLPQMLYEQYGDRRVIERHYPALKKWLEYMRKYVKDDLMTKDTYGDWCVPPESPKLIHSEDPARKTDPVLISSTYYCHLLRLMERYAKMLDKPQDAAEFESLATRTASAIQVKFFHADSGTYSNGTQTSSILPLAFGLAPADRRSDVLGALVKKIEGESKNHIGVGLVGAQWLMRTLSDNGRADLAYTIANQKTYPGWGYMVEKDATTIWELWNGDTADPAMNSGNHVMQIGDLAVWMYEYLAGIRSDPDDPAFHHVIVRPYPVDGLAFVKASHRSMYGLIESRWKREGGKLSLDVVVPPNTTATIYVPAKDAGAVSESGKPAGSAKGVKFVRAADGFAVYEVQSGAYRFVS